MSIKQLWQSLTGKDDSKAVMKSMVTKQDHSNETPEERQARQKEENSVAASTSPGAF